MEKKEIMKELVKLIRNILNESGYDGGSRVRMYKDLSVECLVYGNTEIKNLVITELMNYPQFEMKSDYELSWKEGKYRIYITIL